MSAEAKTDSDRLSELRAKWEENKPPKWARDEAIKFRNTAPGLPLEIIDAIACALVAEYERGVTDGRDDVAVERRERDAYARGVKEERERAATILDQEAFSIEEHERDCRSWGGPDPRGPTAANVNLEKARSLRIIATSIRKGER